VHGYNGVQRTTAQFFFLSRFDRPLQQGMQAMHLMRPG
jgi:hypothetical protein